MKEALYVHVHLCCPCSCTMPADGDFQLQLLPWFNSESTKFKISYSFVPLEFRFHALMFSGVVSKDVLALVWH